MTIIEERLNKKVDYGRLSSFYGPMLTDNQRLMVRLYCDEDLSLSEIAGQLFISRQGVCDAMTRAFSKLDNMESKLGLCRRFGSITQQMALLRNTISSVRPTAETVQHHQHARDIIDSMIEEEQQ